MRKWVALSELEREICVGPRSVEIEKVASGLEPESAGNGCRSEGGMDVRRARGRGGGLRERFSDAARALSTGAHDQDARV